MQQRQESMTETRMGGGGVAGKWGRGVRKQSSEYIQNEMHFKVLFFFDVTALRSLSWKLRRDLASWMYHRIAGMFNSTPALVLVKTARLICTFVQSASVLPL